MNIGICAVWCQPKGFTSLRIDLSNPPVRKNYFRVKVRYVDSYAIPGCSCIIADFS